MSGERSQPAGSEESAAAQFFTRHQQFIEAGFWVAFLGTNAILNATSELFEHARNNLPLDAWEPFVWEFSSMAFSLMLIPAILLLDARYPFRSDRLGRPAALHALATVLYSLIHVGGMVGVRKVSYWLADRTYDFGNVPVELLYEYRKDFMSYATVLAIVYVYRYALRRRRGEASFVDEQSSDLEDTARLKPSDHVLVKKRGKEFIVNMNEIDWIQASGNYVNLHVNGAVYPVRETMTRIEQRLDEAGFARIHRSNIVNLGSVEEIRPSEHGDYRVRMRDGTVLNLSRRFRANLKDRLQ